MTRLLVHVEGQTEETFVNEVLAPFLCARGFTSVSARLIGNSRLRANRGGIAAWPVVRTEIVRHLERDANATATLMVDYYGMPKAGAAAWPGRNEADKKPIGEKLDTMRLAMLADLERVGASYSARNRFLPNIIFHEFEALLFSDPKIFTEAISKPELATKFCEIKNSFSTPEEINDSPITAPSKRIKALYPGYEKPLMGSIAAMEIGINRMRHECGNFDEWIDCLIELT